MGSACILIAEDEGIVAMSTKLVLEEFGYKVTGIAVSGEDAMAQAEHDRPDLVLMDIKLKGNIDGLEAASRIRERLDIPVVLLTGYSDSKTMKQATKLDLAGFLAKPVKAEVLHATIENALEKKRSVTDS